MNLVNFKFDLHSLTKPVHFESLCTVDASWVALVSENNHMVVLMALYMACQWVNLNIA